MKNSYFYFCFLKIQFCNSLTQAHLSIYIYIFIWVSFPFHPYVPTVHTNIILKPHSCLWVFTYTSQVQHVEVFCSVKWLLISQQISQHRCLWITHHLRAAMKSSIPVTVAKAGTFLLSNELPLNCRVNQVPPNGTAWVCISYMQHWLSFFCSNRTHRCALSANKHTPTQENNSGFVCGKLYFTLTFAFMQLADAFILSDLQCIMVYQHVFYV